MTLVNGRKNVCEGTSIIDKLDIEPTELFNALNEHQRTQVIARYNRYRDEYNDGVDSRVENLGQLPSHVYDDYEEWLDGLLEEVALRALENRPEAYVHIQESATMSNFHTIIRLPTKYQHVES